MPRDLSRLNEVRRQVAELRQQIRRHERLYYVLDEPKISDAEFDALMNQLKQLEGEHPGWQSYEALLGAESASFDRPDITERDLLTINYTSGTTSRPKGVMITHRNAYMNMVGTLLHHPMTCADRYLWTLPMFHANRWTFVWMVTAVGGTHV